MSYVDFEAMLLMGGLQKIKKIKSEYRFCCPFHLDKSPSAFFNIDKGVFKCFGCGMSCGYMYFFKHIGVMLPDHFMEVKFEKEPEQFNSYESYMHSYENSLEQGYYHLNNMEPLSMHPAVENWVSSRLYHPDLSSYVIPILYGYNPRRNSIIFQSEFNIVEKLLEGRYMNYGDPAHLFTDAVSAKGKLIILIEGVFDWLVLRQMEAVGHDFKSASMLGTALTDVKLTDLSRLEPSEVALAYDNDSAGHNGFKNNYANVLKVHTNVSQVPWTEGFKDFGDMWYDDILTAINSRKNVCSLYKEGLNFSYD